MQDSISPTKKMQTPSAGHYYMPKRQKIASSSSILQRSFEPEYYKKKTRTNTDSRLLHSFNYKSKKHDNYHGEFSSSGIKGGETVQEVSTI